VELGLLPPSIVLLGEVLDGEQMADEAAVGFKPRSGSILRSSDVHFGLGYLYWELRQFDDAGRGVRRNWL
jgi:hypothetical protein